MAESGGSCMNTRGPGPAHRTGGGGGSTDPQLGFDPRYWPVSARDEIVQAVRRKSKYVLYLAGYAELGYEQREHTEDAVAHLLLDFSPADTLVLSGTLLRTGGQEGIACAYRIARAQGFETAGLHSSIAMRFHATHRVSPLCQSSFFVRDRRWGGLTDDGRYSPTLTLLLDLSHEMVAVGGGWHTADELTAFARERKRIRYVPAEMNHHAVHEWCARAGIPTLDYRGAALDAWERIKAGDY